MKKQILICAIALSLAGCAAAPSMPSSITALTNKVTGNSDTQAVKEDTPEVPKQGAQLADSSSTGDTKPPSPSEFDPVVIPGKNMKGRFAKTPYPDMMGDTRKFAGTTRVSVPSYKVSFDKKAGESASASTGSFGTGPSANTSINAKLTGVDEATFARITNKAYADFATKLQGAGYELVGLDQMNATEAYNSWDADKYPNVGKGKSEYLADSMRSTGKITAGLKWGKLMNETQAAIIMPELAVNFATFGKHERDNWSDGGTATAKVSLGPSVHVVGAVSGTTLDKCDKRGVCYGAGIFANTGQVAYSTTPFAKLDDTTSTGAKVAMGAVNALAMLSGTSMFSAKDITISADADAYEKAALEALYEANTRIVNKLKAADKTD